MLSVKDWMHVYLCENKIYHLAASNKQSKSLFLSVQSSDGIEIAALMCWV